MGRVFGFPKSERLCSKKETTELFKKGVSVFLYPYKIFFLETPTESSFKVLVSCPKKKFPRSVDRKKITRKIKESFRLQKHVFSEEIGMPFGLLAIVYLGNEFLEYKVMFEKLNMAIRRLKGQIKRDDATEN